MAREQLNREGRQAAEVAEAARETEWEFPSFVGELFLGRFKSDLVFPFPKQSEADRRAGDAYLARVETFLRANVDPDTIDRTGVMPARVIKGLADLGAFGIKIPREYGGLGMSQVNYNRVVALVASHCGSTAVWLSAHQSIGVPQPLAIFGTPEQKRKYLPACAAGRISAFALTEVGVGSDPAKMRATAMPTEDGRHYVLNGEKLWCTNGPVADVIVVMAKTPPKIVDGRAKTQITAFIVETAWSGCEVVQRCEFMGLRGIQNGLLRFKNVRVPRENILWGEGLGLKLALITLNTGRLTLPAACAGTAKVCLNLTRRWANERVQWGQPIGHHEAVADKISSMAAGTFAMEAVTNYAAALSDLGGRDIRLEAAIAKLFASEAGWRIVDDALQIRGGRGYETASSLARRGETAFPVERMMRDFRINLIIEGSSEIQRLFIAREAVDPHLKRAGALIGPRVPFKKKLVTLLRAARFYLPWYAGLLFKPARLPPRAALGGLARHVKFVERKSRKLARAIFYAMARYGPKLEKKQLLLSRLVDIGAELFVMSASCSYALALMRETPGERTPLALAETYCVAARRHVTLLFKALRRNADVARYRFARGVLAGKMTWLENGVITTPEPGALARPVKTRLAG